MVNFGPTEGKQNHLAWFFIGLYLPLLAIFLLEASGSLSEYIGAVFDIILTVVSLIILLGLIKSDDKYYSNFGVKNLVGAVGLAVAMTLLSWGLSDSWLSNSPNTLAASAFVFVPPHISSVASLFLYSALAGLVLTATAEELFRLPFFSEGQIRWKKGLRLGQVGFFVFSTAIALFVILVVLNVTNSFDLLTMIIFGATAIGALALISFKGLPKNFAVPGVIGYVGFPVFFWAVLHAIGNSSYIADPALIIPAFVNGILLTIYLWKTKCIFGAIASHWLFNTFILAITFFNGSLAYLIPQGTPTFPNILSGAYWWNGGGTLDLLLFGAIIWAVVFFLLPSLRARK
jgi:hypothetical protein